MLIKEAKGKCQHRGKKPNDLDVHHKNGCGLDNRRENLILLCSVCHALATHNNDIQGELPLLLLFDKNERYVSLGKDEIKRQYESAFPRT